MQCPNCSSLRTKPTRTIPSRQRRDGRVYRYRECHECKTPFSTLEVWHTEAKEQDREKKEAAKCPVVAIPMAAPASNLYDLEGELEQGLPHAVECIITAISPKTKNPDRVKVDAAKWLIEDRRKWRIQSAAQANSAGQTPEDPAMAQLASILRLVPDEEAS